jgi:uncharacterized protein
MSNARHFKRIPDLRERNGQWSRNGPNDLPGLCCMPHSLAFCYAAHTSGKRNQKVKPSDALERKRTAVREATSRFRTANPRVFGSVLHGTDEEGSDLDLLVDPLPGATLFDLGALQVELEDLLGVGVDVMTPGDLPPRFRQKVLAEAIPV